jgi:hypothetical protein
MAKKQFTDFCAWQTHSGKLKPDINNTQFHAT